MDTIQYIKDVPLVTSVNLTDKIPASQNDIAAHTISVGQIIDLHKAEVDPHAGVYAHPLGVDDNYVTDAEKTKLANLSGTNTGDQDLSSFVVSVSGTAPIATSGGTTPTISIAAATTSAEGSMSASDKAKLDGIATSANNYSLPTATSILLGGVKPDGTSVLNTDGVISATKGSIGLGNCDNTSDDNKPVSSATSTALSYKQDTLVSGTNIKSINGSTLLGSGDLAVTGGMTSYAVSTATTAANNSRYVADTTSAAFTITLPATPANGDYIELVDAKGTWATNNLTIARNGSTINGLAQDLVVNVSNVAVSLAYSGDATRGWQVDIGGSALVVTPADGSVTNVKLAADVFSSTHIWSGAQVGAVLTDNDGSFDMEAKNNFMCTPTAAATLTFTNITAGQSGNIILANPSAYTISKAASVKCGSSLLGTISAAGTYWLSYTSPDGTNVYVTSSGALS